MVAVTNVSHRRHYLSEPHNLLILPNQTVDIDLDTAVNLSKNTDFDVQWDDDDIKFKDSNGKVTHVGFLSPFLSTDGYGIIGINTYLGLMRRGVHVTLPCPIPDKYRAILSNHYPEVIRLVDSTKGAPTKWGLAHCIAPEFDILRTPKRLLWTMWEATLLPDQWSLYANKADGLIVPSAGQVPIFRDSGYEGPIYTVVDGIEMDTFQYVERPERDTFTFFTWGRLSSRKCPWEILSCFSEAFDGVKDVRLVMKTRDHEFGAGRTVGIPEIRDSRITAVDADWSRKQLTDALFNADCAVFMSHGEGSMNPPVQAMATGLPVIGPNHSGCSVWANSKYCYPVGLDKHAPLVASPMGMRNGKVLEWWNMDRGEMIQTMRYVYEHQKEAKKKGKAAAAWVRRRHSVDNMLDELIGVLGGLD